MGIAVTLPWLSFTDRSVALLDEENRRKKESLYTGGISDHQAASIPQLAARQPWKQGLDVGQSEWKLREFVRDFGEVRF